MANKCANFWWKQKLFKVWQERVEPLILICVWILNTLKLTAYKMSWYDTAEVCWTLTVVNIWRLIKLGIFKVWTFQHYQANIQLLLCSFDLCGLLLTILLHFYLIVSICVMYSELTYYASLLIHLLNTTAGTHLYFVFHSTQLPGTNYTTPVLMASFPGQPGQASTHNLDCTEARDSEWQWHQLGICKSAPHSRQITMPAPHHSVFYRPDALPAAQPTASRHWRQ